MKIQFVLLVILFLTSACGKDEPLNPDSPKETTAVNSATKSITPPQAKLTFCYEVTEKNKQSGKTISQGQYGCYVRFLETPEGCNPQQPPNFTQSGMAILLELAEANINLQQTIPGDGYFIDSNGAWTKDDGNSLFKLTPYKLTSVVCE